MTPAGTAGGFVHWARCERALAMVALGLCLAVQVLDMLMRVAIGPLLRWFDPEHDASGLIGAPTMALWALVAATWAGFAAVTASGSHLVLRAAPGPAAGQARQRLADAVSALALGLLAAGAARMVWTSVHLGLTAATLDWPLWCAQVVLPAGLASAALRHAWFAWRPPAAPPLS